MAPASPLPALLALREVLAPVGLHMVNSPPLTMSTDLWDNFLFLVGRYIHIVCTALLVGGTLFYEMVVPVAIGELKNEQQLLVFGRARWMFRSIVWVSGILLIASGVLSTIENWKSYRLAPYAITAVVTPTQPPRAPALDRSLTTQPSVDLSLTNPAMRPDWWWVAHASTGTIAVMIALSLTWGASPPARPVQWMRINLTILLVVIFLATATKQVRQFREDSDAAARRRAATTMQMPILPAWAADVPYVEPMETGDPVDMAAPFDEP